MKTKAKAENMKTLYMQIDKDEKRRKGKRFFRNLYEGFIGYLGLLIWIGVVAGVVFLGYLFLPGLWTHLADRFGLNDGAIEAPKDGDSAIVPEGEELRPGMSRQ